MPFWLHWYRSVFSADEIIVTPVKTGKSSIEQTLSFYERENIPVFPLIYEFWDDGVVWKDQLDIIGQYLSYDIRDTLVISADTDQYFTPVDEVDGPEAIFRRIFLYADSSFTTENISATSFIEVETHDLLGAFYNDISNERIHATGHFAGICKRKAVPCEFHVSLRGFEQFHNKVSSLSVVSDDSPGALHWKKWIEIYKESGVYGLKQVYEQSMHQVSSQHNGFYSDTFRGLAQGKDQTVVPQKSWFVDVPFASQLLSKRFAFNSAGNSVSRQLHIPVHEFNDFIACFRNQTYFINSNPEPRVIIDIGASIGAFTLYMNILFPGASIFSFEGVPETFALLEKNIAGIENIKCACTHPGGYDKEVPLYRHLFSTRHDSIYSGSNRVIQENIKIRVKEANIIFEDIFRNQEDSSVTVLRIAMPDNMIELLEKVSDYLPMVHHLFLESAKISDISGSVSLLKSRFTPEREFSIDNMHCLYLKNLTESVM
jgi:FkbM family methyltransferase